MNNETNSQASCIIDLTTEHLDDKTLKQLLISVQLVNIKLCIKYAIEGYDLPLTYVYSNSDMIVAQETSC